VRTALHTATTVGLTALGLLTFVHWGFAIAAITVYVVPPLYLYLSGSEYAMSPDAASSKADRREDDRRRPNHGESTAPSTDTRSAVDGDTDTDADADSDSDRDDDTDSDDDTDTRGTDSDSDSDSTDGDTDGDGDSNHAPDSHWRSAPVPTDSTLRGVTTTPDGPVAAGDGGVVVARHDGDWTRLLDDGPAASGASLTDVAATADGEAVWVAGDGGALGRYDTDAGRFTDHSAPADRTDNLTALAVTGDAGSETLLLANGSGEVFRGRYDGRQVGWADPMKPGGGSSMAALASADGVAYCCDTNAGVFVSRDEGASWSRLGVDDAGCAFAALAPTGDTRVTVAGSDGRLFAYDGAVWTPCRVADGPLAGLALSTDGDDGVACGPDGALTERVDGAWEARILGTDADLTAATLGTSRAVVVGTDGTVLERASR